MPSLHFDKISKKGKYILSIVFILAKDGTLSDIQCELDPGFGICNEVVRIVKKSPRWRPAKPVLVKEYPRTNE